MRYFHANATVSGTEPAPGEEPNAIHPVFKRFALELETSYGIVKAWTAVTYPNHFKVGENLIVSWTRTPLPKIKEGRRLVRFSAIERLGVWSRQSAYKRKFPKDLRLTGYRMEAAAIDKLQDCGARIDPATDYEDEILGIDFWLFLLGQKGWDWMPVNITLRSDMFKYQNGNKYDKSFRKMVLPARLTFSDLEHSPLYVWERLEEGLKYALYDFSLCGQPLVSRRQALDMELRMEL